MHIYFKRTRREMENKHSCRNLNTFLSEFQERLILLPNEIQNIQIYYFQYSSVLN